MGFPQSALSAAAIANAGGLIAANNLSDVVSPATSLGNLSGASLAALALVNSKADWTRPTAKLAQNCPRNGVSSNGAVLSTGRLSLAGIYLEAGLSLSNISFVSGTTGATLPLNQWFAIYSAALARLALTADDTTTAWAADTEKTLAISGGPYVVPTSGFYYLGICVVATTVPTMRCGGTQTNISAATQALSGSSTSGLTTPATAPANAAAPTIHAIPFAYVS